MTTDEVLETTAMKKIASENYNQLRNMLQTADFAKFAKAEPLSSENEQSLADAFEFVKGTKPQPVAMPVEEKKEVTNV
jgi:hypothetical protein